MTSLSVPLNIFQIEIIGCPGAFLRGADLVGHAIALLWIKVYLHGLLTVSFDRVHVYFQIMGDQFHSVITERDGTLAHFTR